MSRWHTTYYRGVPLFIELWDAKDTEKGRKIGVIHVKSSQIRVKVFRECGISASRLDFV